MSQGRISSLRADKGFGFISEGKSSSGDVFFHRSAVVGASFDDLREGQEVTFQTQPDSRDASRVRASNVQLVQVTSDLAQ